MKEIDLDKNLENIIIDGLIKEAEQDNADFATAMRNLSDEEFYDIINVANPHVERRSLYKPIVDANIILDKPQAKAADLAVNYNMNWDFDSDWIEEKISQSFAITGHTDNEKRTSHNKSYFKGLLHWVVAALSATAIILIVLIPSINYMNARLCESALYMSEAYITAPKGGFDVSSATPDEIEEELPALKMAFEKSMQGRLSEFGVFSEEFRDTGWNLAVAYLKLHKKRDALKILKTLEESTKGTPFGDHCKELLKQLD